MPSDQANTHFSLCAHGSHSERCFIARNKQVWCLKKVGFMTCHKRSISTHPKRVYPFTFLMCSKTGGQVCFTYASNSQLSPSTSFLCVHVLSLLNYQINWGWNNHFCQPSSPYLIMRFETIRSMTRKYTSKRNEFFRFNLYFFHVISEFCLFSFRNTKISEFFDMAKPWVLGFAACQSK